MFDFLRLAHPRFGPQPIRAARLGMRVPITERVALPLPIVAYDLPWSSVDLARAAIVADALDEQGIAIAALRCELADRTAATESSTEVKTFSFALSNRICPYRPDRYGLKIEDLRSAKMIDLRLVGRRGDDGRFDYAPEEMRRWNLRSGRKSDRGETFSTGMPAALWPPDVRSTDRLAEKVAELRLLAPTAAICISTGTDDLASSLPVVVHSGADAVAIRADDWPPTRGQPLAVRIAESRRWLDANGGPRVRLIVVPPVSAEAMDVVKIFALGADIVAIDGWCSAVLDRGTKMSDEEWAAANLGVSTRPTNPQTPAIDIEPLRRRIDQMRALIESTGVSSVNELGPQHLVALGAEIPGVRSV